MNKLNYPCDKTPNGLCVDCTNDGPLCDFDECEYMNLNQKIEIQRLNGYIERIDAILYEMEGFRKDCSDDTSEGIGFALCYLDNALDTLSLQIKILERK